MGEAVHGLLPEERPEDQLVDRLDRSDRLQQPVQRDQQGGPPVVRLAQFMADHQSDEHRHGGDHDEQRQAQVVGEGREEEADERRPAGDPAQQRKPEQQVEGIAQWHSAGHRDQSQDGFGADLRRNARGWRRCTIIVWR